MIGVTVTVNETGGTVTETVNVVKGILSVIVIQETAIVTVIGTENVTDTGSGAGQEKEIVWRNPLNLTEVGRGHGTEIETGVSVH